MLCILESPCVQAYLEIILSYRQTSFKAYNQIFNSLSTLSQGANLKDNNSNNAWKIKFKKTEHLNHIERLTFIYFVLGKNSLIECSYFFTGWWLFFTQGSSPRRKRAKGEATVFSKGKERAPIFSEPIILIHLARFSFAIQYILFIDSPSSLAQV